ncbi:MAG: alcohol dehydrogenase catalytic domain-containing protein [Candidatus Hadarchaeum sp.]|uniref:zinc-dependent alcohol dehydrogenase n=1 Tax=Candidatus Hadarchaeum sp. TaxID=2883567 RepID=UPI003174626E
MKGIVLLGNSRVQIEEFPDPRPGPGEVLVRIKVAGICGSDIHFYRSRPEYIHTNIIAGHEGSGIIIEAGDGVENVKIGDRVSIYHYASCGHCRYCLKGEKMLCPNSKGMGWKIHGSDAEYVTIDAENCLPLPASLTFVDGVFLACTGITAYSAIRKLIPSGRNTLAIFGLGPVGLAVILLAKVLGIETIGLDRVPERIDLAKQIGVDDVIKVDTQNVEECVKLLTDGDGPGMIIDTTGNPEVLEEAIQVSATGGRIAVVGIPGILGPEVDVSAQLNLFRVVTKQLTIVGVRVAPIWEYFDMVDLLISRNIHFDSIVTHRFSLDEAQQAFEIASAGYAGKVIFEV